MKRLEIPFPLTQDDINYINKVAATEEVMLVSPNTKGLTTDTLSKLNKNITISITGGLTPKKRKFDNNHYQKRTYYSTDELTKIISMFEKIERKINPLWTKEERVMYVYKTLCEYLTYSEGTVNGRDASRNLLGLINGKSVCSGCAMIFKEAMDRIGINDYYQNQEASHSWNVVEIDGKYYAMELTWDVTRKKNNKCQFYYFARKGRKEFYKDHNIDFEDEEREFYVEEIPVEKQIKMLKKIKEDRIKVDKLNQNSEAKVGRRKIKIVDNKPYCDESRYMTYTRDDGSSFLLIPTHRSGNGVHEYIYAIYDKENNTIKRTRIYSDSDSLVSKDKQVRKNIANRLLSKERIKDKINNYNGYVGYLEGRNKTRFYNEDFEQQVINKYRTK